MILPGEKIVRCKKPDPEKETAIEAKSVTETAARLKAKIFPEYTIGILHGKMKPEKWSKPRWKYLHL